MLSGDKTKIALALSKHTTRSVPGIINKYVERQRISVLIRYRKCPQRALSLCARRRIRSDIKRMACSRDHAN